MIPMVDLVLQYRELREDIHRALEAVLDSGQFILGPQLAAFEQEAAAYLGVAHGVGCASGTDALHLALAALDIGAGDQVITTPFTFIATLEAIRYVGAYPVFVDVDPRTFNLAVDQVAAAITPATRAIIPVHLFGQSVAMGPLLDIAAAHDLHVIEDCAQSFGATWNDKMTGGFGSAGCFSFFPSKNLGAYGDGGLIVTHSPDVAEKLRMLRNHGSRRRYQHERIGFNSRLDELQAAVLRVKLKHIEGYNARRRCIARWYREGLSQFPELSLPHEDEGVKHVYHQYTVLTSRRAAIIAAFEAVGIGYGVYYPVPLHHQPVFRNAYPHLSLPVAETAAQRCLSLPIYPEMEQSQVKTVVDVIQKTLSKGVG